MNPFLAVISKNRAVVPVGSGGFTNHSPITIDHTKVPSTQTDFPVLISVTGNRFKSVFNGGHVNNANGYDIRPYSDSGLTTALTYELERYNASTGEVVMWVKVASLSSSVNTVIHLGYGNTSLITNGSSTATWSNSYLGVYHLGDGTTLNVNSATGSNNGTNVNTVTAAAGQIAGCGSFASASTQHITLGSGMNPASETLSAWAKATSFPAAYNAVVARADGVHSSVIYVKSNGKPAGFWTTAGGSGGYGIDGTGSTTMSTGTWYYLAWTWDSTNVVFYVNAAVEVSAAHASSSLDTTASPTWIGGDSAAGFPWNGQIDEVHIANVVRSADWMTTEYNNQNSPSTFMTLGTEV